MDRKMVCWMDGWIDEKMVRLTDGWIYGYMHAFTFRNLSSLGHT